MRGNPQYRIYDEYITIVKRVYSYSALQYLFLHQRFLFLPIDLDIRQRHEIKWSVPRVCIVDKETEGRWACVHYSYSTRATV